MSQRDLQAIYYIIPKRNLVFPLYELSQILSSWSSENALKACSSTLLLAKNLTSKAVGATAEWVLKQRSFLCAFETASTMAQRFLAPSEQ